MLRTSSLSSPALLGAALALMALLLAAGCGRDGFYRGVEDATCTSDADCLPGLTCNASYCEREGTDTCTPGASSCSDATTLRLCRDDGAGWVSSSCRPGLCADGACVEQEGCRSGEQLCADNDVYVCSGGEYLLDEACEANETCEAGQCVPDVVDRLADIVPVGFGVGNDVIQPGEPLYMWVEVANVGGRRVPATRCDVYFSWRGTRPEDSFWVGEFGVPPLGVGESTYQEQELFVFLESGSYTVFTACDADNAVRELSEDNNIAVNDFQVQIIGGMGEADLEATYVAADRRRVQAGETFGAEFSVANVSDTFIGGYVCGVYVTPTFEPNPRFDLVLGQWDDGGLAPFEERFGALELFVPDGAQGGENLLYMYCEAFEPERRLDNNLVVAERGLIIEGGQLAPDLTVNNARIDSPDVAEGGRTRLTVQVCNQGGLDVIDVPVVWRLNGNNGLEIARTSVRVVRAGACVIAEAQSDPLFCSTGETNFRVQAAVDPFNQVTESNEQNNTTLAQGRVRVACNGCVGDRFDPDDVNRPPFAEPVMAELVLCPGDTDLFELPLAPGATLRLNLEATSSAFAPATVAILGLGANGEYVVLEGPFDWSGGFAFEVPQLEFADRYFVQLVSQSMTPLGYQFTWSSDTMLQGPDLVPTRLDSLPQAEAGQELEVSWTIQNAGTEATPQASIAGLYVVPGRQDNPLRRIFVARYEVPRLAAGSAQAEGFPVVLPATLTPGPYAMVFVVDDGQTIMETNERNNVAVFRFDIVGVPLECTDAFEPNNSFDQAVPLPIGTTTGVTVCGLDGGDDYFRFCPPEGSNVDITVSFSAALGDVDIIVSDANGQPLMTSNGTSDQEHVALMGTGAGACYFLQVYLFGGRPGDVQSYTIDTVIESPNACFERAEPNNDFAEATPLLEVQNTTLDLCPAGDVDMFQVDMQAGEMAMIQVNTVMGQPAGDLSVTVYGPNRNFLTFRFARDVEVPITAQESGPHYVRVVTSSAADAFLYTISIAP